MLSGSMQDEGYTPNMPKKKIKKKKGTRLWGKSIEKPSIKHSPRFLTKNYKRNEMMSNRKHGNESKDLEPVVNQQTEQKKVKVKKTKLRSVNIKVKPQETVNQSDYSVHSLHDPTVTNESISHSIANMNMIQTRNNT